MTNRPFVAAFLAIAFINGCSPSTGQPGVKGQPKESGVTVGKPTIKTLRRVIEQPASVEAFEETPLVARISGYVDKVNVDIGKTVKRDEILAELSVPEMVQELEQKKALVTQAGAEVEQAVASLKAADAAIDTAKSLMRETEAGYDRWKSEYKRVEELVASKVVDRQIRDEALNQYKVAEAKVQSAKAMATETEAKRDKAKADVDAAKARVAVALAEQGRLKALVDYRQIRAPYDGVVTRRNIHTGHFLQPNPGSGAHVVFVIARTDTLRIQAEIPEAEAAYISDGLKAKIEIPTLRDQSFGGKVARTSVSLDAKSRTLRTEIDFPNKDGKLRPGMYANLVFTIDLPDRRTLPNAAIFTHADQPCCWRVVDGKAVRTPVKLGVRDGSVVEVLKMQTTSAGKAGDPAVWESVTGEEEIILTNLGSVTEGKEVRIK